MNNNYNFSFTQRCSRQVRLLALLAMYGLASQYTVFAGSKMMAAAGYPGTPDVNVTLVNVTAPGNVSINDQIPAGATYGTPVAAAGNPAGGSITMVPDGNYIFTGTTPGVYTYNVPVCLTGVSGCPTVPLVITVQPDPATATSPLPPIANTDITTVIGPAAVTLNVRVNDKPGNTGGTLNVPTVTAAPSGGTASVTGDGKITYTPNAGFYGYDMLTYKVCETPSGKCASATEVILVLPPGSPNSTIASDDFVSITAGTPATGNVKDNDTDPEGNTQTISAIITATTEGVVIINDNGSFTFVPTPGFTGPVNYPYTTCDNGSACSTATLYILVTAPAPAKPDLTNSLVISPSTFIGNGQTITVRAVIKEVNNSKTNGDVIVLLPISSHYTMNSYSPSLTSSNGLPVQNANWTYLGVFGTDHAWQLGGTSGTTAINGGASSAFAFTLICSANGQGGTENLVLSIYEGSGGETNFLNNKDSETMTYSSN